MLTEALKELREKLSTQSAIAEHMTGEVARLKGELETANSRLAAHQARVDELSKFLRPVTSFELTAILDWVDRKDQPGDDPDWERLDTFIETIRKPNEKDNESTALAVLATALRESLSFSEVLRLKEANAGMKQLVQLRDKELAECKQALTDKHDIAQDAIARAEKAEAHANAQAERIRYLEGATNHAGGTPLSKALARAEQAEAALTAARQRIEQLTATNAELNILSSRQAERIESLESQVAKLRLELSDTQEHYATIERLAQRVVDTEWGWDGSCGADIPAQEIIDLIGDLHRAAQVLDEGGKS